MTGSFVQRVAEILHRYNMIPPGARLGVGVSGGADSVVLLRLLIHLREEFPCQLTVLHLNHQLRGVESDSDEAFVRGLALSFGLDFVSHRATLDKGNLEQEARRARRNFFGRICNERNLSRLALGHTRSDQAETVLYRFLRGSGTAGLAAMRPVTPDGLIRPLLQSSREEVRAWAREQGIAWREDATNQDTRFARNLLRNEAIPFLTSHFNPGLEAVLAGTAALAQAEEDYWDELVGPIYARIASRSELGSLLQIEALNDLHLAARRRVIRRAIAQVRGDLRGIDFQHVESVLALTTSNQGHDRVIIPGVDALRSYDTLLLTQPGKWNQDKRHYRVDLELGHTATLPFGLGAIRLEQDLNKLQNCATVRIDQAPSTETAYLNGDALRGPIHVRNWEPGDGFLRPGHSGFEKLKTLFQEHRILLWERRHWPVLMSGDEVIWTKRFGCSAKALAGAETRGVIRLEYLL